MDRNISNNRKHFKIAQVRLQIDLAESSLGKPDILHNFLLLYYWNFPPHEFVIHCKSRDKFHSGFELGYFNTRYFNVMMAHLLRLARVMEYSCERSFRNFWKFNFYRSFKFHHCIHFVSLTLAGIAHLRCCEGQYLNMAMGNTTERYAKMYKYFLT